MTEEFNPHTRSHGRTDTEEPHTVDEERAATSHRSQSSNLGIQDGGRLLKVVLIAFWGLFWFWNVVDHVVTTDGFPLFKGRFRYDGMVQLFSTIGVENHTVALVALNVATVLEIAAFVSLTIALWYIYRRDARRATDFFTMGMVSGLVLMTYFSVGDVVFGHRAELREHTLYWMFQVITLVVYLSLPNTRLSASLRHLYANNRHAVRVLLVSTLLISSVAVATSVQRMDAVSDAREGPLEVDRVSDDVYRLVLPPGVGQETWEASIEAFERSHPGTCVTDVTQFVWPAPNNAKILYLTTEDCG